MWLKRLLRKTEVRGLSTGPTVGKSAGVCEQDEWECGGKYFSFGGGAKKGEPGLAYSKRGDRHEKKEAVSNRFGEKKLKKGEKKKRWGWRVK